MNMIFVTDLTGTPVKIFVSEQELYEWVKVKGWSWEFVKAAYKIHRIPVPPGYVTTG